MPVTVVHKWAKVSDTNATTIDTTCKSAMSILIIGDVHGKYDRYMSIVKNYEHSIQLGDMGLNYTDLPVMENHKFFMGNHDNYVTGHPNCLGDFGVHLGCFYIRGAKSIDKASRLLMAEWFPQEELGFLQTNWCMDMYKTVKPLVVLSHDCPQSIKQIMHGIEEQTHTSMLLQHLFDIHQPELWLYGHHHHSVNTTYCGTDFRCLDELEFMAINLAPQQAIPCNITP
jgi:hypothetical protein